MGVRDTGSQSQAKSQPAQQNPSANPPIESMSPSSTTALRNSDDLRDAYISGRIELDVYHEKMRAIGEIV